ncbi:MAG TPA: substrate-binding domain-containing protein [Capsulimonadaceae bacterium]|jgi:DNA-binding LacI/PurR family transcriptional regulator
MANLTLEPKTKPEQVRDRLIGLAQRSAPGDKLASVQELCKSLSVSNKTLDIVLRQLESEKVITRKRGVGIFVRNEGRERLGHTVCLIGDPAFFLGEGHSPFYDIILEEAQNRVKVRRENFEFHLAKPHTSEGIPLNASLINEITNGRVHGILAIGTNERLCNWLLEQGVPFVGYAASAKFRVRTPFEAVVECALPALRERGCKRISYWPSVRTGRQSVEERLALLAAHRDQFTNGLEKYGMPHFPELVQQPVIYIDSIQENVTVSQEEQGVQLARNVFSRSIPSVPDGVLIDDDVMARGALKALHDLGVQVGRDVHFATICNKGSSVLRENQEPLVRIEIDPYRLVQGMLQVLDSLMDGRIPQYPTLNILPNLLPDDCADN